MGIDPSTVEGNSEVLDFIMENQLNISWYNLLRRMVPVFGDLYKLHPYNLRSQGDIRTYTINGRTCSLWQACFINSGLYCGQYTLLTGDVLMVEILDPLVI